MMTSTFWRQEAYEESLCLGMLSSTKVKREGGKREGERGKVTMELM